MNISGKKIIIFGGTSGIGEAATKIMSDKGATEIIAISRNPDKMTNAPKNVTLEKIDVLDEEALKSFFKNQGKFDVLINASPVGMVSFKSPVNSRIIKNCSTVIDFVLSDKQTKILKLAKKFNKQTISGNSILIHQIPAMLKFYGEKEISDSKLENLL